MTPTPDAERLDAFARLDAEVTTLTDAFDAALLVFTLASPASGLRPRCWARLRALNEKLTLAEQDQERWLVEHVE